MPATIAGSHLGPDTHGNRPAANAAGQPIGAEYACTTHSKIYKTDGSTWSDYFSDTTGSASGSITASGYTQSTARLLGRTTASTGAIEEITVGTGLSLSAGSLTATGGGGSITDIGTTSVGGSTETPAGSAFFAKAITPASTKPIMSIRMHIKGDGSHTIGPIAAIFDDNAGAVGKLIAYGAFSAALYGANPSTTYRWVNVPLFYVPANGTQIWIVGGCVVNNASSFSIAYAGSGTDRKIGGTSAMTDGGWGSSTGNDYSIYAQQFG